MINASNLCDERSSISSNINHTDSIYTSLSSNVNKVCFQKVFPDNSDEGINYYSNRKNCKNQTSDASNQTLYADEQHQSEEQAHFAIIPTIITTVRRMLKDNGISEYDENTAYMLVDLLQRETLLILNTASQLAEYRIQSNFLNQESDEITASPASSLMGRGAEIHQRESSSSDVVTRDNENQINSRSCNANKLTFLIGQPSGNNEIINKNKNALGGSKSKTSRVECKHNQIVNLNNFESELSLSRTRSGNEHVIGSNLSRSGKENDIQYFGDLFYIEEIDAIIAVQEYMQKNVIHFNALMDSNRIGSFINNLAYSNEILQSLYGDDGRLLIRACGPNAFGLGEMSTLKNRPSGSSDNGVEELGKEKNGANGSSFGDKNNNFSENSYEFWDSNNSKNEHFHVKGTKTILNPGISLPPFLPDDPNLHMCHPSWSVTFQNVFKNESCLSSSATGSVVSSSSSTSLPSKSLPLLNNSSLSPSSVSSIAKASKNVSSTSVHVFESSPPPSFSASLSMLQPNSSPSSSVPIENNALVPSSAVDDGFDIWDEFLGDNYNELSNADISHANMINIDNEENSVHEQVERSTSNDSDLC